MLKTPIGDKYELKKVKKKVKNLRIWKKVKKRLKSVKKKLKKVKKKLKTPIR